MKGTLTLLFQKMKSRLFSDPCSSINYCLLFIKARGQALAGSIIIHCSVPLRLAPPPTPPVIGKEAAEAAGRAQPAKDVPSAF